MTKTLTEQWKDMDLADEHLYYWRMPNGEVRIMSKMGVYSYKLCYDGDKIDILAPVPSYDEYKELVGKTDKLEKMAFHYTPEEWNTMLRTIERLQEQLNEAHWIIKLLIKNSTNYYPRIREAKNYLRKYGVDYDKIEESGV